MTVAYWLSDHPSIVNFRWSPSQSFGATWSFLFTTIAIYISAAVSLHVILRLLLFRRRISLGPIPAGHSLVVALTSAVIFTGILISAAAEIRDTRWLRRRRRRTETTAIQWLLCFPLGTRPSGRVFFWSYAFYLSRFLHLLRTFIYIIRRRRLVPYQLLNQSFVLCMCFLWLEFSQSFQVLAILFTTLSYCIGYGYRFGAAVGGLPGSYRQTVAKWQAMLVGCQIACQFGVLCMHFNRGGCNGIGAWLFNSILNAANLFLFFKSYYANARSHKKGHEGLVDHDLSRFFC